MPVESSAQCRTNPAASYRNIADKSGVARRHSDMVWKGRNYKALEKQKRGLMQKLLTGEIRVFL